MPTLEDPRNSYSLRQPLNPHLARSKMVNKIDHPAHYAAGRKYEPIDVIEDWNLGFHLGNAVKYLSRAGRKEDALEDLKKAVWYIDREIKRNEPLRSAYEEVVEYLASEAQDWEFPHGLDDVVYYNSAEVGATVSDIPYEPVARDRHAERLRVYELARELGVTNKVIMDAAEGLGITLKAHSSSLQGSQVEEVRSAVRGDVDDQPLDWWEAEDSEWAAFWDSDDDYMWDPSLGPVELTDKEIQDILDRKDLQQFDNNEIVSTIEKRGFIIGVKADGTTCELGRNGRCL